MLPIPTKHLILFPLDIDFIPNGNTQNNQIFIGLSNTKLAHRKKNTTTFSWYMRLLFHFSKHEQC